MVPQLRIALIRMTPPDHADQLRIVHKLAALRQAGTTGESLLAALEEAELEVMLWDFPDDLAESLTLFALITAVPDEAGMVSEQRLTDWIQLCASWLCLEWLKRRGAVVSYALNDQSASWQTDAAKLTSGFLDDLSRRHPALHHFAAHIFRRAAPVIEPGAPALN